MTEYCRDYYWNSETKEILPMHCPECAKKDELLEAYDQKLLAAIDKLNAEVDKRIALLDRIITIEISKCHPTIFYSESTAPREVPV